jgi:hypothetical protein
VLRTAAILIVVLAAGVAAAGPKTVLGKWMQPNVATPLSGQDFAMLQKSLQLVSDKAPPADKYPRWSAISKAGADAARKKDLKAVRASCKNCHDAYKSQYIKEFPMRPFP